MHLDPEDPPNDLVAAIAEIPDSLVAERIDIGKLPPNWRERAAPPVLTRFGDDFAKKQVHCLLLVPSVLAPGENNYLINPEHRDFKRIVMRGIEPLSYDPFGKRHP